MRKAIFNQGRIIPNYLRWILTVVIFTAIYYSLGHFTENKAIVFSITLSFLIPPLWSSYHILEVNKTSKMITQAYWLVGFKIVKRKYQGSVFEVKIVEENDQFYSRIVFKDGTQIEIASNQDENSLKTIIAPFLKKLNISIYEESQINNLEATSRDLK